MTFNGFVSYSHAADGRLAPAVQRGLHRLAKPWHRRRALWIFRDQTGLAVTPGLWSSIQNALDGSEYFVLLASPEAAQSHWVNREIEHWIATKSADQILPVVTDGEWAWDQERHDFTEDSTAVPAALRGVFAEEPLFLDLRWARGSEHLSLQHSRFRDAIAQLAAPMHGVSKDELEGEDVRQHRRARRLRSGAVATLVVLTLLAGLTSVSAVRNADRATAAAAEALRQQQVAETQRTSAELSAEEASRQQEAARQQQSLAASAAIEAQRSEQLAQEQQRLADRATAEARRQQQIADQAARRTREQQRLAEEAALRAQQLEQEAQRLEAEVRRLWKIAEEKQREAREAAEEAKRQQAKAEHQQRIAISRRLTTQARAAIAGEPKTALMLGAAAQALLPDIETRTEVTGVVTATSYAGVIKDATSAVYGPDGVLATLGVDLRVSLWNATDTANPARIATLSDPVAADTPLTFSPDGRTLAVVNPQGAAVLWDVADRSHPVRLVTLANDGWEVNAVAFSRDGTTLALSYVTGITTLSDLADRSRPQRLSTYGDRNTRVDMVQGLVFSADGRTLLVDTSLDVEIVDVTDRADPFLVDTISERDTSLMAFDPTGSTLVMGEDDGEMILQDMRRPATARVMQDQIEPPPPMPTLEPDPADNPDNDPYWYLSGPAGLRAIAFSPDGRFLAAGSNQGTVMVWDLTNVRKPMLVNTVRANGAIHTLSFDPDGGKLVTGDGSSAATFWNTGPLNSPDPLAALTVPEGPIRATALRPDGRTLVVAAGPNGTVSSWNVTDPARPVRGADLTIRGGDVGSMAFSPDGRTAASVGKQDGLLTLTDMTRPQQPVVLPVPFELGSGGGMRFVFSPDGRTLALAASSIGLLLWNVADRTRPALLATLRDVVPWGGTVAAFSPDGRTLAIGGGDRILALWDVTDRSAPAKLGTLAGHNDRVESVAFSPDGRTVASGSKDTTAMLWNIADRARPGRIATLTGHDQPVTAVAFSPDGRTLATGDSKYQLVLWDTANPAGPIRLISMRGPGDEVQGVLFKHDGRTLAVAANTISTTPVPSKNATVTLWNYAKLHSVLADPAKHACAMAGRGLDANEWARYIPELPYRRTCTG